MATNELLTEPPFEKGETSLASNLKTMKLIVHEHTPRSFHKILNEARGLSLIGAAVCLVIQVPLLADSPPAIQVIRSFGRANTTQSIPVLSPYYGIFVSAIIAGDLFSILAFCVWYFVFRERSQVGALGALLTGVIAYAVDLTSNLSIRSSTLLLNGIAYKLVRNVSSVTFLASTFMLGVAFLFLGYSMLKTKYLFGSPASYLAPLCGILLIFLLPLSFSSDPTRFLIFYMGGIIGQIALFVLAGKKIYRM